jgi:CheY-like chemotaxis protein
VLSKGDDLTEGLGQDPLSGRILKASRGREDAMEIQSARDPAYLGLQMERRHGWQDPLRKPREPLMQPRPFIAVVDDDESVRESLPDLLRELGYEAKAFGSAKAFLDSGCLGEADCLILDIGMPGMTGPELQRELAHRGEETPIVFITALGDKKLRSALRQKGAVDVLFKPFSREDLRTTLNLALRRP